MVICRFLPVQPAVLVLKQVRTARSALAPSHFAALGHLTTMLLRPLKAGSLVMVRLDNGRVIQGQVKAVVVQTNGKKYQVSWDYETARVSARHIIGKLN